ncbi:MAG: hypothetical protein R3186_01125 [Ruegeria sp.]|nr:hypothetical protein [Ruegeria sp.]
MTGHLRYSEELSYVDFLIGARDELDIEAEALHTEQQIAFADGMEDGARLASLNRALADMKSALRRIDELKISGAYEEERERLAKLVEAAEIAARAQFLSDNPAAEVGAPSEERLEQIGNLFRGLRSPDAAQKERFEKSFDAQEAAGTSIADIADMLPIVERSKRPRGPKAKTPPWLNEAEFLDQMRLVVAAGKGIHSAAMEVADEKPTRKTLNRGEWLAKLYRMRMELRE